MRSTSAWSAVGCAIGLCLMSPVCVEGQGPRPDAEGFIIARPAELVPEEGSRSVAIIGNQREEGFYVVRLTWAPGSGSRPHYHDQARFIQVLKGTWYVSTGAAADVYDPDNMIAVEEGSFIYEPPFGHHYDMAKDEEVIVQIWGVGPVTSTQIPQPDAAGAP